MTLLLASCFLVLASCSSDDVTELPKPEEAKSELPYHKLVDDPKVKLNTVYNYRGEKMFNLGNYFIPNKNGVIKGIGVILPEAREVTVGLWNVETKKVIIQKKIKAPKNASNLLEIDPVKVVKGKEYVVSVYTDTFYVWESSPSGKDIFPVTVGNVKLTGSGYSEYPSPIFPVKSTGFEVAFYGLIDIIYQARS